MILNFLFQHRHSNDIAMIEGNNEITYKQLYFHSLHLSCKLFDELPSKKIEGKIVGIFLPNSIDYVISFFAAILAKKIVFPLNIAFAKQEIVNFIVQSKISVILTSKNSQSFFEEINKKLFDNFNGLQAKIIYVDEEDISTTKLPQTKMVKQNKKSTFLLLSTSGTTGNAKIIALTPRNVCVSVNGFLEKLYFVKKEYAKFLINTPYFTAYGIMTFLSCIKRKIPFVVMQNSHFSIEEIFKLIEKHKVTHYEGSSLFVDWLEKINPENVFYDLSTLKYVAFGGNKVYENTIQNAKKKFPSIEFFQGYGMSEASPLISKPSLKKKQKALYQSKLSSVGTVIKGAKLYVCVNKKLVRTPNTQGEIVFEGKNVMLCYYNNPQETQKIKIKNKLYTGDIGYFDKQGFLYIIGRKKNIINVMGLNVYPEEVEDVLERCEYVKECLVYAENKLEKNETVCVDIVLKDTSVNMDLIKSYIKENLGNFKRPKKINIVEQIERVETQKKKR